MTTAQGSFRIRQDASTRKESLQKLDVSGGSVKMGCSWNFQMVMASKASQQFERFVAFMSCLEVV